VWLTSDSQAADHGLAPDREFCEALSRETGRNVRTVNKLAVRIRVKIPPNDQRLVYWPKWAKKRLSPYFYEVIARTGGNMEKTWWLYKGVIPPKWFVSIDVLEPANDYELEVQNALMEGNVRDVDAAHYIGENLIYQRAPDSGIQFITSGAIIGANSG
jgi:hypothetical protein